MVQTAGIQSNISTILDAVDYLGKDAVNEVNTNYSNGNVANCSIPSGEIFNSGWVPAPTLAGMYELIPTFDTDVTGLSSAEFIISRRTSATDALPVEFGSHISIMKPSYPNIRENSYLVYFDPRYEYNIRMCLMDSFPGTYFILDNIQFVKKGNTGLFWKNTHDIGYTSDKTGYVVEMVQSVETSVFYVGSYQGNSDILFNFSFVNPPNLAVSCKTVPYIAYIRDWIYNDDNSVSGVNIGVLDPKNGWTSGAVTVSLMAMGQVIIPVF